MECCPPSPRADLQPAIHISLGQNVEDHFAEDHNTHEVSSKHPAHTSVAPTRKHIIARPRARQFFYNGILHLQSEEEVRQASRFELFLDVLYIALCANLAEDLIHAPDGYHLVKYILVFIPAWQIWSDLTILMNGYYNDDLAQRFFILLIMSLMLFYGNNAIYIDKDLITLQSTLASYILARASVILVNFTYSWHVPQHTLLLRSHALLSLLCLAFWTPVFLENVSTRLKIAFAVIAMFSEHASWTLTHSPIFKRVFKLKYSTAVDIDHHIDRMSAFFVIVLGEFLYGMVMGSPAALDGVHGKFGRAAMCLCIAFTLCWLYTSTDGARHNPEAGTHALRWRAWSAFSWFLLHLPLSASLIIAGDICAVFVKDEGPVYGVSRRAPETEGTEEIVDHRLALRWMFCGSLSVGLLCLWLISFLHHESDEDEHTKRTLLMPKGLRRITRLINAIIIVLLPLRSMDKLSTTDLLGVITALLLSSLLWELVGGTDRHWHFIEPKYVLGRTPTWHHHGHHHHLHHGLHLHHGHHHHHHYPHEEPHQHPQPVLSTPLESEQALDLEEPSPTPSSEKKGAL